MRRRESICLAPRHRIKIIIILVRWFTVVIGLTGYWDWFLWGIVNLVLFLFFEVFFHRVWIILFLCFLGRPDIKLWARTTSTRTDIFKVIRLVWTRGGLFSRHWRIRWARVSNTVFYVRFLTILNLALPLIHFLNLFELFPLFLLEHLEDLLLLTATIA